MTGSFVLHMEISQTWPHLTQHTGSRRLLGLKLTTAMVSSVVVYPTVGVQEWERHNQGQFALVNSGTGNTGLDMQLRKA